MRHVLEGLRFNMFEPVTIYYDNTSAINISKKIMRYMQDQST